MSEEIKWDPVWSQEGPASHRWHWFDRGLGSPAVCGLPVPNLATKFSRTKPKIGLFCERCKQLYAASEAMNVGWQHATEEEYKTLAPVFSRLARQRGKEPDLVYVRRVYGMVAMFAMKYEEPGMWDRWGIQLHPPNEIVVSWSVMAQWLRELVGDKAAVEVYPQMDDVVNTRPVRWFWMVPYGQTPTEMNLKTIPRSEKDSHVSTVLRTIQEHTGSPSSCGVSPNDMYQALKHIAAGKRIEEFLMCDWPDCYNIMFCCTGNAAGARVCREHFKITNGKSVVDMTDYEVAAMKCMSEMARSRERVHEREMQPK